MKITMNKLMFVLLFVSSLVHAQFSSEKIVDGQALGAWTVFAADLDGDGYKDVLSANMFGSNLTWYKNMGNGTFGPQQIIASLSEPLKVFAADLDGDNDMDVLAAAPFIDSLVWYENLDGLGNFGAQQIINDNAVGANDIKAVDIDDDGDLDVISGSDSSGLAWYENLNSLGDFSAKKVINASAPNSRSVMAIDLDGDSDLDIVASSSGAVTVSWYENLDGLGDFGPQQVIAGSASAVSSIFAVDLDGDLDNDVLATTNVDNKVAWFENTDGLGNFGTEQLITTQAVSALSVFAADLDNDDDMDVLSASAIDDKVAWYENIDGLGNFGSQQILNTNADSARSVIAIDLDNDGDKDVLSASRNDDKIAWYENLTILGVEDHLLAKIEFYPNPVSDSLSIINKDHIAIKSIQIYDIEGRLIFVETEKFEQLDLTKLSSGILFVKISTDTETIVKKVLKE